jgi:hypothetical protein
MLIQKTIKKRKKKFVQTQISAVCHEYKLYDHPKRQQTKREKIIYPTKKKKKKKSYFSPKKLSSKTQSA